MGRSAIAMAAVKIVLSVGVRGLPGQIDPADRVRIDAAIETAETINARMAETLEARDQAVAAAQGTAGDAQATAADRQQAAQAASDAEAARAAAEAARLLAEQERQAAESYAEAAAQSADFYDSIVAGRAAVADGETFGVRAFGVDGLTRPAIYRRDSASTQTLINVLASGTEVAVIQRKTGSVDDVEPASIQSEYVWDYVVVNRDGYIVAGLRNGRWVPEQGVPQACLLYTSPSPRDS